MKRISKLTALLLAIALVLSVAVPAIATEEKKEDTNRSEYDLLFNSSVQVLYQQFMACTTYEDVLLVLDDMTWDEFDAFVASLSEEDAAALQEHVTALFDDYVLRMEESIMIQPVNFTRAAKFKPPVQGTAPVSSYALRSAPMLLSNEEEAADNGLEVSKIVSGPDANGQYTITLEAYATGEKVTTTTETAVPTDIVLVLDQSGSMDFCMRCGESMDSYYCSYATYTPIFSGSIRNNNYSYQYFIKVGGSYQRVYYCDGGWYGNYHDAGWFLTDHSRTNPHPTNDVPYIPMDSADDTSHTQFYLRETKWERTHDVSRLTALINAVTAFVNSVNTKAKGEDGQYGTADDINHRIAMVGFSSDGYKNTEVFIGSTGYDYYKGNAATVYDKAFQDMDTKSGYANVVASIGALDGYGGTQTQDGIAMANGIFNANPIPQNQKRNRVMIVFTDGVPGQDGFDSEVAKSAIDGANTAKTTYGATVYSVGIFSGADATSAGNSSGTEEQKANWFMQNVSSNNGVVRDPSYYLSASDSATLTNIFQKISSDIESGGSSSTLTEEAVVKDIIADSFQLPENANTSAIKVYTADYTAENTFSDKASYNDGDISINGSTISVSGFNFSENWVGTETTNGSVTYRGKKLIIEIPIVPKTDFLGGNDVPTNGATSGVYADSGAETAVENFNVPEVDVPVKTIKPVVQDQNIYLTNAASLTDLVKDMGKYSVGQDTYTVDGTNNAYVNITYTIKDASGNVIATYTIPAGTNATTESGLVDIVWKDANGNEISSGFAVLNPSDLTNDTDYTITCTVAPLPKAGGEGAGVSSEIGSNTATVNVFKPEITFQDSVEDYLSTHTFPDYYTDTTPTGGNNYVSTVWKHKSTNSNGEEVVETAGTGTDQVAVNGTAPELNLTYTVAGADIQMVTDKTGTITGTIIAMQDIPVNVTAVTAVTANDTNDKSIDLANVTFVHQCWLTNLDTDCTWISNWTPHAGNATKSETEPSESIPEFLIHVKNIVADLTITKTGLDAYVYKDSNGNVTEEDRESAIITVTATGKDGTEVIYRFALANNQSVTIKDLKVGSSYTVAEENGWTWRYKAGSISKATGAEDVNFVIDKDPTKNQVTITNHADNPYWLGGDNYKVNVFGTTSTASGDVSGDEEQTSEGSGH